MDKATFVAAWENIQTFSDKFVYLAKRDSLVKIGVSREPARRASTFSAVLLGYFPGSFELEMSLHTLLNSQRRHGEWFDIDDSVVELLLEIGRESWSSCGGDKYKKCEHEPLRAFRIRFSPDEWDALVCESEKAGVPVAEIVRGMVRRRYRLNSPLALARQKRGPKAGRGVVLEPLNPQQEADER